MDRPQCQKNLDHEQMIVAWGLRVRQRTAVGIVGELEGGFEWMDLGGERTLVVQLKLEKVLGERLGL